MIKYPKLRVKHSHVKKKIEINKKELKQSNV